jgi:DNA-binding transcriptional ArsR family regulator
MNDDRQRYAIHAAVFAALSNPTRHELMHHLCDSPKTPSELAELLEVSRPNVSQHLAILHRDGLVLRSRQDGRVLWEVVNPRLREACELIDEIMGPELARRAQVLTPER